MVLSDHVEEIVRSYFLLMIEKYRDDADRQDIVDWVQEEVSVAFKFHTLYAIHCNACCHLRSMLVLRL